ncbi:hypothetical protein U0070_006274 [Myodes glareolus]|uniref:Uncharacterized protein n=1 Tax=Myodes glareolus TaxID=447135 RepID=A0AAW0HIS3_MYOGA
MGLVMASNKLINGATPGDTPNHHTERNWHLKTRDKERLHLFLVVVSEIQGGHDRQKKPQPQDREVHVLEMGERRKELLRTPRGSAGTFPPRRRGTPELHAPSSEIRGEGGSCGPAARPSPRSSTLPRVPSHRCQARVSARRPPPGARGNYSPGLLAPRVYEERVGGGARPDCACVGRAACPWPLRPRDAAQKPFTASTVPIALDTVPAVGGAGHLESEEGQASSPVLQLGKPRVGMELGAFKKERGRNLALLIMVADTGGAVSRVGSRDGDLDTAGVQAGKAVLGAEVTAGVERALVSSRGRVETERTLLCWQVCAGEGSGGALGGERRPWSMADSVELGLHLCPIEQACPPVLRGFILFGQITGIRRACFTLTTTCEKAIVICGHAVLNLWRLLKYGFFTGMSICESTCSFVKNSCGQGHDRGGKAKDKEWIFVTKLGRLVKDLKIKSMEEIYLFFLPIKESKIIDFLLGPSLKDED